MTDEIEQANKFIKDAENKKAIEILEKIQINHDTAEKIKIDVYGSLAMAYTNIGNYDSAIDYSKKTLELIKNNDIIIWNLGLLYEMKKNFSNAKKYYRQAEEVARLNGRLEKANRYNQRIKTIEDQIL